MSDNIKIALIVGVSIFVSVCVWSYVTTKNSAAKLIVQQEQQALKTKQYEYCINYERNSSSKRWEDECNSKGLETGCLLPLNIANSFNNAGKENLDRCKAFLQQ